MPGGCPADFFIVLSPSQRRGLGPLFVFAAWTCRDPVGSVDLLDPKGSVELEARVGIEPAFTDLQSGA